MKYFTLIDLKDGFFQIPMRYEEREKTAFYTGTKLMQFKKMPQGISNSSAKFQRAMNFILRDLINTKCIVYIDDILIYGKTHEELDINVKKVKERLKQYKLIRTKLKESIM